MPSTQPAEHLIKACAARANSYRLEISSNVIFEGGAISGTWSEATRNVSGTVSGRATSAEMHATVTGGAFLASLDVRTHGDRQTVAITPQGGTDVAPLIRDLEQLFPN